MAVLNQIWAIAHLEPGSERIVFSYPDLNGRPYGQKRYVFFDTVTLERAGIPCHNVAGVQSLTSLLVRIGQLQSSVRKEIRWFTEVLDGTTFNTVYFPSATLHQVTTVAASASHGRSLYIGGAMEVIPTDDQIRRVILHRLSLPSPLTPQGPAVSEMRHIRGQPYSVFTMKLLTDLVGGSITSVTQRMNWFETQVVRQAVDRCAQALQQASRGKWEDAERSLLEGVRQLAPLKSWVPELLSLVEQCQQDVSGLLLADDADRADMEGPVLLLLRSVGLHVGKT